MYQAATAFGCGNHPCIKMTLQKAVHSDDCNHDKWGLFQDAAQMKLDVSLSAMHFIAEACRLMIPTALKNFFVKGDLSIDHASSESR
jgi:hypothetical protein